MADATRVLNEISGGLDQLANQVLALAPGHDSSFMEHWGWNMPGMNKQDLADYVRAPKAIIGRLDPRDFTDADVGRLSVVPARIQYLLTHTVNNLPSGNAANAWIAIDGTIRALTQLLQKYDVYEVTDAEIDALRALPTEQLAELRKIQLRVKRLGDKSLNIETKVEQINAAHEAAEKLPDELQALEDAQEIHKEAEAELIKAREQVEEALSQIKDHVAKLEQSGQDAQSVLTKAQRAYSAATTQGLGAAFTQRAGFLNWTTAWLGLVLVATLGVGGWITYLRVDFVHQLMMKPTVTYGILWLNVTFTALSVSGPIWLAWLLTRQIGQRFRLAEDYGYKAAVARAYEGYRAEAGDIDPELSKKLFGIALDMLAEAPLRLVEKESPGSPMHEARGPIAKLLGVEKASRAKLQKQNRIVEEKEAGPV